MSEDNFVSGNKPSSPSNNGSSNTFTSDSADSVDSASGLRHRIFAGNLDFGTTKEQLYEAFAKCGKIVDEIRLHPGYAFIQFDSEQACSKAVATLSGTQLCSKRIDVQMAKGPNHSQKKEGTKRKLDSRDNRGDSRDRRDGGNRNDRNDRFSRDNNKRDMNNNNKKQKRTPPPNNPPPPSNNILSMSSTTPSPYSSASSVVSVPIYIPDQTLEPFANFVLQTLKSGGLIYHNVHIRNTNQGEMFFTSPQFLQLVANERFVIYIVARHEISRNTVSFKALMPDGSCPGFADTMITDICSFILSSPPPPQPVQMPNVYQQYAMQYSAGVPQSTGIVVPGMSFGYNNNSQQSMPSSTPSYNPPRPSPNQNYGGNNSSNRYNNNRSNDNRNNNNRNDNRRNNDNNMDRRNNNNRSNNYRGGNNNTSGNYHQKDSTGSSSSENNQTNEVQGLIIKLLDTINKKPSSSNSPSILLSESASTTGSSDNYHDGEDHNSYQ